jgi:NADH-quinone oxidoreductase subunit J
MFESLNSILSTAYFSLFALIAIGCGGLLLLSRHPLNGAIALVGVMLSLSGIYALLSSPFLAVLQVLVYAGAIMMLVVFVIMVLNQAKDHRIPGPDWFALLSLALPLLIGFLVVHTVTGPQLPTPVDAQRAGAEVLAVPLFDFSADGPGYYLLFEMIGILLLIAVVAAVLLAKRSLDTPAAEADGADDEAEKDAHHAAH